MACASSCKFEHLSLVLCFRFVLLSIIMYAVSSMLSIGSRVEGIDFLWVLIWHIQLLFLAWPAFCLFSLAVRDLSNLVKPEDIIISENLITLLAIIPKYSQKDWLASYETLTSYVVRFVSFSIYKCFNQWFHLWGLLYLRKWYVLLPGRLVHLDSCELMNFSMPCLFICYHFSTPALLASIFQVPRSSKKLYEDNEYALYTVTLFHRVADNFRTSSRDKGFQVSISVFDLFQLYSNYPKSNFFFLHNMYWK